MIILNENNKEIDFLRVERPEQLLAQKYILPDDTVLELGGRYGSVSCTINPLLNNPNNHVVVEPDDRVWDCLETNKKNNNCNFHIIKGCISSKKMTVSYPIQGKPVPQQYVTVFTAGDIATTPSYSLAYIQKQCHISAFNVLIADCEGCFPFFLQENYEILSSLRLIILEKDQPKLFNYDTTIQTLIDSNFTQIDFIKPHHFVYTKSFNGNQ